MCLTAIAKEKHWRLLSSCLSEFVKTRGYSCHLLYISSGASLLNWRDNFTAVPSKKSIFIAGRKTCGRKWKEEWMTATPDSLFNWRGLSFQALLIQYTLEDFLLFQVNHHQWRLLLHTIYSFLRAQRGHASSRLDPGDLERWPQLGWCDEPQVWKSDCWKKWTKKDSLQARSRQICLRQLRNQAQTIFQQVMYWCRNSLT